MHIFTIVFFSIALFDGLSCVFSLPTGGHHLNPRNVVPIPRSHLLPTDNTEFQELVPRVKTGGNPGGAGDGIKKNRNRNKKKQNRYQATYHKKNKKYLNEQSRLWQVYYKERDELEPDQEKVDAARAALLAHRAEWKLEKEQAEKRGKEANPVASSSHVRDHADDGASSSQSAAGGPSHEAGSASPGNVPQPSSSGGVPASESVHPPSQVIREAPKPTPTFRVIVPPKPGPTSAPKP